MKTVKDYRNLGLVFVKGDFTIESDGSSNRGDSCFDVDWYFNQESAFDDSEVESFAWRNNDGAKPEYKGLVEILTKIDVYNGGADSSIKNASDVDWRPHCCSHQVAKWRPVVLKS